MLCFLNLSSFCSAVSEARRALSLSLLRRSLLALISADSEDRLELESIDSENHLEVESILQTDKLERTTRTHGNGMLQSIKLEHANGRTYDRS